MTFTGDTREAAATVERRLSAVRLGKSITREMDADILALRDAHAAIAALHERLDAAAHLIRDFTDPDPCWFDHAGGCQAHGYLSLEPGELCPHAEAKRDWIPAPPTLCPECVQGKHGNCIEQTLNDADEWVPCGCPEHGATT